MHCRLYWSMNFNMRNVWMFREFDLLDTARVAAKKKRLSFSMFNKPACRMCYSRLCGISKATLSNKLRDWRESPTGLPRQHGNKVSRIDLLISESNGSAFFTCDVVAI